MNVFVVISLGWHGQGSQSAFSTLGTVKGRSYGMFKTIIANILVNFTLIWSTEGLLLKLIVLTINFSLKIDDLDG